MTTKSDETAAPSGARSRKRVLAQAPLPSTYEFNPEDLRLGLKYVPTADLKPPRRALRKYAKRADERMERSIRTFGFLSVIVADHQGRIIVGYRRWLAAKAIGLSIVPVIPISHLSEDQLQVYTILDNKLCEDGEWDLDELRASFADLSLKAEIVLEDTGFLTSEIDNLCIVTSTQGEQQEEDETPSLRAVPVTRLGNIWSLGQHLLICGSCLEQETFERLLGSDRAQMVFSDAPYNLSSKTISGKGKTQHGDFAMASGEMPRPEFTQFLKTSFELVARYSE